ncbi:MAG: protein kinase [Pirellulales bacterium]|nr:protein kinase [Pirellulales bacterium]
MAITSPEEFLQVLNKSKLLSPEQLAHAQDTLLLAGDAEALAEILVDEGFLTEWQALRLLAGQTEPFFIGNYVLLDMLGRGGMGSVFLARHTTMKRQVALKIISRKVGKDPASRDRFLSEARAAAALDHPNIVRAFDVDKDRERHYIVMEYVAGVDLNELVREEGPLDFAFAVDCIRQAAEGLAHAHRRNMAHCDIKPSNLLVTETGTVKILDMGMARLLNQNAEDSSGDRDGKILGTVDYMAPEQAMEGPDFDHRADIYSLGCTMYYLLTGRPPFDEGTLTQRIVQHQTQPPPDILLRRPDTPPELARICLRMMAKDPADRFQTADELAKILSEWRPPVSQAVSDASAAGGPTSTGVAIDEEDFKEAPPLEPVKASAESKSLLEDERRLILWVAGIALIVGGLLVVVFFIFLSGSGGPDHRPPVGPAPQASVENPQESSSETAAAETPRQQTPVQEKPGAVPSPPQEPAAESVEPPAPPKQTKPAKRKPRKRRPTPKPPEPNPDDIELGLSGDSGSPLSSSGQPGTAAPSTGLPEDSLPKPDPGTAPKASEPFHGFPEAVDLPPAVEQGDAVVLGKLSRRPEDELSLRLLGGESAVQDGGRFLLERRPDAPQWNVRLVGAAAEAGDVARFTMNGDELTFAWLNVPDDAPADHLRNCLLEMRVGKQSRIVRFAEPQATEPLTFLVAKGTAQKRFSFKNRPQNGVMRLAITAVDGLPNNERLKRAVVLALGDRKDEVREIPLFDQDGCRILLRVKYSISGNTGRIEAAAFYRLATRDKTWPLSATRMPTMIKQAIALEKEEQRLKIRASNPHLNDAEKASNNEDLQKTQGTLKWLKDFFAWYQVSQGVVQIQFQEFIAVEKHRIVLLDTNLSTHPPSP